MSPTTENALDDWDALVSVALVGTARRAPIPAPPSVAALVAGLDAPHELLVRAVAADAIRRAAPAQAPAQAPVPPAGADTLPAAPPEASRLLDLVLAGAVSYQVGRSAVIGEWLDACVAADRRLDHAMVVDLLALATTDRSLRRATAAAAGERGRWLAGLEPAWAWCLDAEPSWDDLSRAERRAALDELFRTDPDGARQQWRHLYSTEPAAERAALWAVLGAHARADDGPLLEAALDDRSKAVRAAAAGVAHCVPDSAYGRRMTDRLAPLVSERDDRRSTIVVAVPPKPDAGGVRDGLGTRLTEPPLAGGDADLARIVGSVPLAWWEERTGRAPAAVVQRLADSAPVAVGFYRAAVAQRSTDWLVPLLRRYGGPPWMAMLDPPTAQAVVAEARFPHATPTELAQLVAAVGGPWSREFSVAAVDVLRRATGGTRPADRAEVQAARVLSERLHPAVADQVNRLAAGLASSHPAARAWRSIAGAVTFRASIKESFR